MSPLLQKQLVEHLPTGKLSTSAESGWPLPTAGIVQTIAGKRRAPVLQHPDQRAIARRDVRLPAVIAMRASDQIGDDAFHRMEEELDWLEMAGGSSRSDDL